MSYYLVDNEGRTADLATNSGLDDLMADAPPELDAFFESGVLNEEDRLVLIEALSDSEKYDYIADALVGMEGPVIISNGIEEDEEEE